MKKSKVSDIILAGPTILFLLVFFILPSCILLVYSFWTVRSFQLIPGFSWVNYSRSLSATGFYYSAWMGIRNGLWTALISVLVSFPVAYYIVFKTRSNLVLYLALLSWFSSYLVRVYAWRTILGSNGLINSTLINLGIIDKPLEILLFSPFAVVLTLVHIMLPFSLLLLVSSLRDVKQDYIDAARDLGASWRHVLWKVILPMAHKGLLGSFMFTFVLAAGDYVTPQLLGGTEGTTTGLLIANQFRMVGNWPLGAAMAFILLAVFLVIYLIVLRLMYFVDLAPGKRYSR
ncbi:ABC transporter permease [Agrobacterium larrymoorei]|uniref:ABC transporter permease n=1 Tax=Agrobacterium larrymoorei TaxID=160699 RepID=A0A4D7E0T0_9HYPH|nr:ABC transporter permease [Agrobacterium larrymoorei]QCJ01108.1 ABC transporter permease [Agrobacterium larrymoorei]QYA10120.1 ABC transporter permease [Agrobacterium larrymoorei]